jgi:hypothetical protein
MGSTEDRGDRFHVTEEEEAKCITALVGEGASINPPTLVPAGCLPTSMWGRAAIS